MTEKPCTDCGVVLSLDKFWRMSKGRGGRQTRCIECQKKHLKTAHTVDPERRRNNQKASVERHKYTSVYKQIIRRSNGAMVCTREEFNAWWASTPLVCAYCGATNEEARTTYKHWLHVDRKDNSIGYLTTNMVRACQRCNFVKSGYLTFDQMKEVAGRFFTNTYYDTLAARSKDKERIEALQASLLDVAEKSTARIAALEGAGDGMQHTLMEGLSIIAAHANDGAEAGNEDVKRRCIEALDRIQVALGKWDAARALLNTQPPTT